MSRTVEVIYLESCCKTSSSSYVLCMQAVSDVERGWILTSDEQATHLSALLKRGSKKEVNMPNHAWISVVCRLKNQ